MKLSDYQFKFTRMLPQLLTFAHNCGYEVTVGECYRTPAQASLNAQVGIGIKRSLHSDRLAIDINLFQDGKYLTGTKDYEIVGKFWESIGGNWGGRFKMKDGNHFSLSCGDNRQ